MPLQDTLDAMRASFESILLVFDSGDRQGVVRPGLNPASSIRLRVI